jgi:hypothetical protein
LNGVRSTALNNRSAFEVTPMRTNTLGTPGRTR